MNIKKEYKKVCDFLENLSKLESPFSYMKNRDEKDLNVYLKRMQEFLDRVGNPETDMKFIHITGTSGKGTTVALIHNMLKRSGYNVGSTYSPATTTTIERIKVNDLYIDPKDFIRIVNKLEPIILDMYLYSEYGKPSYFDILFATALVYFKEQHCDYIVLEVGMGGRYDSTNIIKNPIVTVITNIGYDHIHLLGNSLEDIAYEKAGIIKNNTEFFTTERDKDIINLFKKECIKIGANFNRILCKGDPNLELVNFIGNFLKINKEYMPISIQLPCRFENVNSKPHIILDGAHNVSKVRFSLKKLKNIKYNRLFIIFGASHTKDALGMLDLISDYTKDIILTFTDSFRGKSFSIKDMKNHINDNYPDINVSIILNPHKAMSILEGKIRKDDLILVIGSLYLSGDIRKRWYSEEYILNNRKSF